MTTEKTLILPSSKSQNKTTELKTKGSFLFIGANGSGKTRFGTWIEFHSPKEQKLKVHRISAHKSLSMPDNTTIESIDKAESILLFGSDRASYIFHLGFDHVPNTLHDVRNKLNNKWNTKPVTHLQNDYQALMLYLFSEQTEINAQYRNIAKASEERIEPPLTKLDKVKQVWEIILPHRELLIGKLRIQTKIKNTTDKLYQCSEMSDGERVIFYLIGQCLAAPEKGIVIIDEPELHLQKSIQVPLWAEIEKLRPDCLFVYLTHDVEFAAAQVNAKKIWLKSYDGNSWEWDKIAAVDNFPEGLLIEILGSRKPIVFVEGENGKFDVTLYRLILDKFLVIPRGSCTQVIQSVKALKNSPQLHHLEVHGIIDRDRRTELEIKALIEDGVYVLGVAEVENLFCTPEILEFASEKLARNFDRDFAEVKNHIFKSFKQELENQASLKTASEIKFQLNRFSEKAKGKSELETELNRVVDDINVSEIYESTYSIFLAIIENEDYDKLLCYYNRKSLAKQISGAFGLKNNELVESIIRYAQKNDSDRNEIKDKLKKYFDSFAQYID